MSYHKRVQGTSMALETQITETFTAAMSRVYLWMAAGLLSTAVVAWIIFSSDILTTLVSHSQVMFLGLVIAELILVLFIAYTLDDLTLDVALILFFMYASLNGATLAAIAIVYGLGKIMVALAVTAVLFGIMSLIGFATREDLNNWIGYLFMGLTGLLLASIANLLMATCTQEWIITYAGNFIFLALTIYDTRHIRSMAHKAVKEGQQQPVNHIGALGALRLYLDFINFLLRPLYRLWGRRQQEIRNAQAG